MGIDGADSKKIADAWIKFQENWWAWDKLDELCRKDAKGAWTVLQDLVEAANGNDLLEDIGVGPLEDFLNYYADDYIDELEQAAANSEALAKALTFSQLRDSNHALASRIADLGCRVGTLEAQSDAFDDEN